MERGLLSDTTDEGASSTTDHGKLWVTPSEFELMTGVKQPVINPTSEVTAMVKGLDDAIFVEDDPTSTVNEAETWEARQHRKIEGKPPQRMGITAVKSTFRSEYSKAVRPLKQMNDYWQQHPYTIPSKKNTTQQLLEYFTTTPSSQAVILWRLEQHPFSPTLGVNNRQRAGVEIDLNVTTNPVVMSCKQTRTYW